MMSLHHARSLAQIYICARDRAVKIGGGENCNLRFLLQMEKIGKDRQHSPVLV